VTTAAGWIARLGAFVVLVAMLAACGPNGSSPSAPTGAAASAAATAAASTGASPRPTISQSDTEWGRIWDSLPAGFPAYAGSTPDETGAGGPASAVFVVDGLDAKDAVTFFETVLKRAGWTTVELSEPLEDGSVTLDMTGNTADCKLRVTGKPNGSLTTMTVLYGAACPNG
jgi:hypothetical protein